MPTPRRSKTQDGRQHSLFEEAEPAVQLEIKRPYNHARFLLGTSAFTVSGWAGSFYPVGMKSDDYLAYYASKFKTVEIDSTYYGTPAASTVESWYRKTPSDFIFAAKVPPVVTHTNMLLNCEAELDEFIGRMTLLKEKLGPLLFQFPHFSKDAPSRALPQRHTVRLSGPCSSEYKSLSALRCWTEPRANDVLRAFASIRLSPIGSNCEDPRGLVPTSYFICSRAISIRLNGT